MLFNLLNSDLNSLITLESRHLHGQCERFVGLVEDGVAVKAVAVFLIDALKPEIREIAYPGKMLYWSCGHYILTT